MSTNKGQPTKGRVVIFWPISVDVLETDMNSWMLYIHELLDVVRT